MAGVNTGHNHWHLLGSVENRKFSLAYFRDDELISVDSINRPLDHMLARKLLENGPRPSPEQVSDTRYDDIYRRLFSLDRLP